MVSAVAGRRWSAPSNRCRSSTRSPGAIRRKEPLRPQRRLTRMVTVRRRFIAGPALAISAIALAGCTTHPNVVAQPARTAPPEVAVAPLVSDNWATYHQPSGPMHLSFRHPASWRATGSTFAASMGNVGIAYLEHDLSRSLGSFPIASSKCRARAQAVRGHGVLIVWSATVDGLDANAFSESSGKHLTIHGWPARLQVSTVLSECAGRQLSHVPERVVTGVIKEGEHTIQRMSAAMGLHTRAKDLATVRRIFKSTRE